MTDNCLFFSLVSCVYRLQAPLVLCLSQGLCPAGIVQNRSGVWWLFSGATYKKRHTASGRNMQQLRCSRVSAANKLTGLLQVIMLLLQVYCGFCKFALAAAS